MRDVAMLAAGALLAVVVEGGTLVIVVAVMWRRHIRSLDR